MCVNDLFFSRCVRVCLGCVCVFVLVRLVSSSVLCKGCTRCSSVSLCVVFCTCSLCGGGGVVVVGVCVCMWGSWFSGFVFLINLFKYKFVDLIVRFLL